MKTILYKNRKFEISFKPFKKTGLSWNKEDLKEVKLIENGKWVRSVADFNTTFRKLIDKIILDIAKEDKMHQQEKEWSAEFDGLTTKEKLNHPLYSHCRSRNYGVTMYARCSFSPTGVKSIGGMTHEEERKLNAGAFSPTECLSGNR